MPVSVPTACISVSVAPIVASGSFLGLTSSLALTSVFSVASAGLYRISIYTEGFVSGGTSFVETDVETADDNGASIETPTNTRAPFQASLIARCAASTDISLSATITSGSPIYSIFYAVEQLQ